MAWCRQATSHCLSQCWLRSMSPYGTTRPQWVCRIWFYYVCILFLKINIPVLVPSSSKRNITLSVVQWLHSVRDQHGRCDVSDHRQLNSLLNSLFMQASINTLNTLLAFCGGIHRWTVNFPHKGPAMRNAVPCNDISKPWPADGHVLQTDELSTSQASNTVPACMTQDDVIKWKHFPRYWPFCAGNSPVTGEFPAERPVTQSFDVFFHLCLNKRLSKQSPGW